MVLKIGRFKYLRTFLRNMLSDQLRNQFMDLMKTDPQKAIKELQKDPKLLQILLNENNELKKTKEKFNNERIKYINMNSAMQDELREQATKLNTTQGLLIGAGVLFFLKLLSEE
ncbi:hypothetical protein ACFLZ7_01965 [Nanoarchaeota archaeon]